MDLPDPGIEIGSPALQEDSLPAERPGKSMAESEGELKSLLSKGKEQSEKSGLKLNIQNKKIKKQRLWHPVSSLHGK